MKKRYIYTLLFGIPGLFIAGIISIAVFAVFAGILWLYVFGDRPWPAYSETVTSVLFGLLFLLLWTGSIGLGYVIGKRLENDPVVSRNHVLISVGLTVMFLLLILLQQWSVGNLGPKSDSLLCSKFCVKHGYPGSGMPPIDSGIRACSCYDNAGNEALTVPLDYLRPAAPK